jgi:hypothetical protein
MSVDRFGPSRSDFRSITASCGSMEQARDYPRHAWRGADNHYPLAPAARNLLQNGIMARIIPQGEGMALASSRHKWRG